MQHDHIQTVDLSETTRKDKFSTYWIGLLVHTLFFVRWVFGYIVIGLLVGHDVTMWYKTERGVQTACNFKIIEAFCSQFESLQF